MAALVLLGAGLYLIQNWIATRTDAEVGSCYDVAKAVVGRFDQGPCSQVDTAQLLAVGDPEDLALDPLCAGNSQFIVDRPDDGYCFGIPQLQPGRGPAASSIGEFESPGESSLEPVSKVWCSNYDAVGSTDVSDIVNTRAELLSLPVTDIEVLNDGEVSITIGAVVDGSTLDRLCEGSPATLHFVVEAIPLGSAVDEVTYPGKPTTIAIDHIDPEEGTFLVSMRSEEIQFESISIDAARPEFLRLVLTGSSLDVFNTLAPSCFEQAAECPTRRLALVAGDRVITAPTVNAPNFDRKFTLSSSSGEDTSRIKALLDGSARSLGNVQRYQTRE